MLILFDYDGVLVDSFDRLLGFVQRASHEFGVLNAPTAMTFRTTRNLTFAALAHEMGLSPAMASNFSARIFELQRLTSELPRMFDGVKELLTDLARSHTLGIVTASSREETTRVLKANAVDGAIALTIDGQIPGEKWEKIQHACGATKMPSDEVVMIGDTYGDITNGRRAGVLTIAVGWGYQSLEFLRVAEPDYQANHPNDIVRIVDDIIRA